MSVHKQMEVSQEIIKILQLVSKNDNNWAQAIMNNETSQSFRQSRVYKEKIRHTGSSVNKIFWLKTLKYGLKYSAFCFIVLIFSSGWVNLDFNCHQLTKY